MLYTNKGQRDRQPLDELLKFLFVPLRFNYSITYIEFISNNTFNTLKNPGKQIVSGR